MNDDDDDADDDNADIHSRHTYAIGRDFSSSIDRTSTWQASAPAIRDPRKPE